jgi:hypothetical protein
MAPRLSRYCSPGLCTVAGRVDSGKSTLVAVLTLGAHGRPQLDDGRGRARMNVLRHKHEIESGRTSSISQQLLGYDEEGGLVHGSAQPAAPASPATLTQDVLAFRQTSPLMFQGIRRFLCKKERKEERKKESKKQDCHSE